MDQQPVHALEAGLFTGAWTCTLRVTLPAAVAVGQEVMAGAALGQLTLPTPLQLVDVATVLGLEPTTLASALQVQPGQQVAQGDVLAARRNRWQRRTVIAPCPGTVQGLAEGCLLLRPTPTTHPVNAPLAARVTAIAATGEITLQCSGTRLACAWARGVAGIGVLFVATAAADELGWQHVTRQMAGLVLVGGRLSDGRALRRARQFGLAGLVVGSIAPALLVGAPELPLIATEGLGNLPMSPPMHAALTRLAGQTAWLNTGAAEGGPYVAVAHPVEATTRPDAVESLGLGARVRLTRAPYLGQSGEIVDLPTQARRTALGTLCEGALVALTSGQRVFVPWANLERLI